MDAFNPGERLTSPLSPPARLRILPIWGARGDDPTHYVILDRLSQLTADQVRTAAEQLVKITGVPAILFPFEVELPDVDDDYRDDEELVPLHRPDGSDI